MDPELATRAAARHLHDLYNHFGDWNLAMAAYNCGPGCVDHAIQRTGFADFWQLRRLNVLPKETANYVPAILAMTIIGKNAKDYGLDDLDMEQPLEYDTIELESPTHHGADRRCHGSPAGRAERDEPRGAAVGGAGRDGVACSKRHGADGAGGVRSGARQPSRRLAHS